jgi:uncharacterized protein (DUF342 family)
MGKPKKAAPAPVEVKAPDGPSAPDGKPSSDALPEDALDDFLAQAAGALPDEDGIHDPLAHQGTPGHRRLKITVSDDGLEAQIDGIFADTDEEEVRDALSQARVVWGVDEASIKSALQKAATSGHVERNVTVARGKPAVYLKRKEVRYPAMEGLVHPKTGDPLTRASSVFHEIREVLGRADIEKIKGYNKPVVAVAPGEVLMIYHGEDEVEPGRDVYGKELKDPEEKDQNPMRAGQAVATEDGGDKLVSERFGFLTTTGSFMTVLSPLWISPDKMSAYYVNPPQMGEYDAPTEDMVHQLIQDEEIVRGVDHEVIHEMVRDLTHNEMVESCVRVAHGDPPKLSKGQIQFTFEPPASAKFEALKTALQSMSLASVLTVDEPVVAVRPGTVLAVQADRGSESHAGTDLFGEPVAAPDDPASRKNYKAGVHVRREEKEGLIQFIAEIFGYFGVMKDELTVVTPIWLMPDRMVAYLIAYPQRDRTVCPSAPEVDDLLERMRIRHGEDPAAVAGIAMDWPESEDPEDWAVRLASGTPAVSGTAGEVTLLFKTMPDPGAELESGSMDFRDRDAVPQATVGDLLARRSFPTAGVDGMDVRGRTIKAPRSERGLLYSGPGVNVEENEEEQLFYAAAGGWPRVIKDTLSVMNRFAHRGNVDYATGNLDMEGDVEIEGSVKSRFVVKATGDVLIGGTLERRSTVIAGGNVIVKAGIINAKVKAGGSVFASFIQESDVEAGENLLVRNYTQESNIRVGKKATVQGNEGGERQLCLLGGVLLAGEVVDATSIGGTYGRGTRVVVGISPDLEARQAKYKKGLSFADLTIRRTMRALQSAVPGATSPAAIVVAIKRAPPNRQEFLAKRLKEMETLNKLKTSLDYHLGEIERQKEEFAARAEIRVPGTVFQKVTVQIGRVYELLEADKKAVLFKLNKNGDRIVPRVMGG